MKLKRFRNRTPEMIRTDCILALSNYSSDVATTGSRDWVRVFIVSNVDGCTIGRVNFRKGRYYNYKPYNMESIRRLSIWSRIRKCHGR